MRYVAFAVALACAACVGGGGGGAPSGGGLVADAGEVGVAEFEKKPDAGKDGAAQNDGQTADASAGDVATADQAVLADESVALDEQTVELAEETVADLQPADGKDAADVKDVADTKDAGAKDAAPETVAEVVASNCGGGADIATLLTCPSGAVDVSLKGLTVTYVGPKQFLVYDGSTTRGMMFYFDAAWPFPKPKAGDVIDVRCMQFGGFQGQQECTAAAELFITGTADPLATAIDLGTAGKDKLGEEYESRLLVGKGLVVKQLTGNDGVVTLPGAGDFPLRVEGATTLCPGASFELKSAGLTQYGTDHRVQLLNGSADLGIVDVAKCGPAVTFDTSNWGFEEVSDADPPPDFIKVGAALKAVRTTAQFHGGKASAQLTWTSTDNQDLVGGYQLPVTPGQKATVAFWVLDNDPAGKARVAMTFYKADKTTVVSSQYGGYSANGTTWVQLTYGYTVPADAAFVRGLVRLYDDTGWAGTATVYVDDFSVTAQ